MTIPEEFKQFTEKVSDFFQKNNITPSINSSDITEQLINLQNDISVKDKLIEELQSNLTESISLAEQLQSQVELLSANKSVPPNMADPKLNINKTIDEDTAGKALLKELPYQDRMKLKTNPQF